MEIPLPKNYVAKKDIVAPKLPPAILHAEDRQESYDFVDTPETLKERYIRQLQAMRGIDRLVGALRETLKKKGLDQHTIIVFTSDHGLFMGQFGLGGKALNVKLWPDRSCRCGFYPVGIMRYYRGCENDERPLKRETPCS